MSTTTSIEWTDATWSPLRVRVRQDAADIARQKGYMSLIQIATKMQGKVGHHCERISAECRNCYADRDNHRCRPGNGTGLPFDRRSRDLVVPEAEGPILDRPLKWRDPKRIFVENQSDLFGDWWEDWQIAQVFAVMGCTYWHTFQVLTKRHERMRRLLTSEAFWDEVRMFIDVMAHESCDPNERRADDIRANAPEPDSRTPLKNVWLGVSAGNQKRADERILILLQTPAALRFVSYEPALGPVGFTRWLTSKGECIYINGKPTRGLDWLICGGESGPGARPFNIQWARDVIEQCKSAGVPFFMKQLGAKPYWPLVNGLGEWAPHVKFNRVNYREPPYHWDEIRLRDRKGGDVSEWPEDLRVRQFPEVRAA